MLIKKNLKPLEFTCQSSKEFKGTEDWWTTSWGKVKIATVAQGRLQSSGRFRLEDGFNAVLDCRVQCQAYNRDVIQLCQEGQLKDALKILDLMSQQGLQASPKAYALFLQECIRMKALTEGKQLHAFMAKSGIELNIFLWKILINMYVKCGSLLDARQAFNVMPKHDVISWTTIISAYVKHRQSEEAVNLFKEMQQSGVLPDKFTFVAILKACASLTSLERGKEIHDHIIRSGCESDIYVGNTLVDMYAKCGSIFDAHQVFSQIHERDVVSWNAIIAGYVQHGYSEEALALFEQMEGESVKPDRVTFASILKACSSLMALEQGKKVHAYITECGIESDAFVGNSLVDMYAKCGDLRNACQVFNGLPERDVVSWTAMIAGYAQQGNCEEAFKLFKDMQLQGVKPDKVTFVSILKACTNMAALEWGKQVHAQVIGSGLESDMTVGNTLVYMYTKCGGLKYARQVFNRLTKRDAISWNVMIAGYAEQGYGEEALRLFEQMQLEIKPDIVTFVSILKACASLTSIEHGKQVHGHIIKNGFESDVFVGSTLVDMYAKCGSIKDAHEVFSKMHKRNVVSWNAMIAGYVQHGHSEEALVLFEEMQQKDVKPDIATFVSILKACARLAALEQGKQVHACIVKSGFEMDIVVGNTLIDMYVKCGNIENALQVFNRMHVKDVVSWTAMIGGYTLHGHGQEALTLLEQMHQEGIKPDVVTFVNTLKTCGNLAALEWGKQVHAYIIQSGFAFDVSVANSLLDMYAKCGAIENAHQVFNQMHEHTVVSWTVMIAGYAQLGHGYKVLSLFEQMQQEGVKPDNVTFVNVLSACSHAGLVNEGHCQFDSMSQVHGITPTMEHYACMVDLLGRACHLEEVVDFINRMPTQPNSSVWMPLLDACKRHGYVELGRHAFACVHKLEPKCAGAYVSLSNIYAVAGKWDEVAKLRKQMVQRGVKKEPGCSWIEIKNEMHLFFAADRTHPQIKEIESDLKRLTEVIKKIGYAPDLSSVLQDVRDEQKEDALCNHSEKLAITFGLISTPPGKCIRINKNLRVCNDCHNATKFICKIVGRVIIAWDANRFHHFKDGICSCGDYW